MSTKKTAKQKQEKSVSNMHNVDLLDEDRPIAGQKYVCLSFISPEEILKQRDLYFFENFLKDFEIRKSFEKFQQFINFVSYKYNIDTSKINSDLEEFCKEERDNLFITTLPDDYKTFCDNNEERLNKMFNEINNFQTSTRGIKVRGVFASQQEAEMHCKLLREHDPNHDVYVGQVGLWMPFHPEAYKTGKVEYLEKELNQLMYEKQKNDEVAKEKFNERVKSSKQKAIKENIEKASKTGNKLMQSIDEEGNLINADRMDVPGKNLLFGDGDDDDIATANLRKELFNSDDVIIGVDKSSDHGAKDILDRQMQRDSAKQGDSTTQGDIDDTKDNSE